MDPRKWEEAYLKTRRNLRARQRRISIFKIDRESLILDYGCGDGLDMIAFHNLGYNNVYGLDCSSTLLSHVKGFDVMIGDAYRAGLASNSFDVVFINSVLHHLEVKSALQEITRILNPRGELCLIEPTDSLVRRFLDWITLSNAYWLFQLIPFIRFRRKALEEEWTTYRTWLHNEGNFLRVLQNAGFTILFVRRSLLSLIVKCRYDGAIQK